MSAINTTSRWDAADYASNAAFVPALGAPVVELLDPRPGERILDLGCGDGVLTETLVALGAVVTALDASESMVDAAVRRGLDASVADGQSLDLHGEFDAVFSNAALHWMLDADAVAAGVFRALRPGGRFVGEMGGAGNIATLRAGIREELEERGYPVPDADPQWYPTPAEFRSVYSAAGFTAIEAVLVARPTLLPSGVSGWLKTFRSGFMDSAQVPDSEQESVANAVELRLAPRLQQDDGSWLADYVRLRFAMRKPA